MRRQFWCDFCAKFLTGRVWPEERCPPVAGSNPVSPIGRERFGDNNPLSTPLVKGATIHLTFKIGFIEN